MGNEKRMRLPNILMLSMERDLFKGGSHASNFAKKRMAEYSKLAERITIIVHSTKAHGSFKEVRISENVIAIPTNGSNTFDSFRKMYSIGRRICSREQVDLITTQDPFGTGSVGYFLKRQFGIPLLIGVHGSYFDNPEWLAENRKNLVLNSLGKAMIRKADAVRVECETERRKIIELGVSPEKVFVSPVLVDLKRFARVSGSKVRRKYKRYKRIVLYMGRLSYEKDISTLLRAAKIVESSVPKALFLVVGGGPEEQKLLRLAKELRLKNTIFEGRVDSSRVPEYYAACDVFVLPSIYEGISLARVEAHASSKPIITTDTRDSNDIVLDGRSGFIVPKRDHYSLAERINLILSNPEKAKAMGRVGRDYVSKAFDPKKTLDRLGRLWRDTAFSKKPKA